MAFTDWVGMQDQALAAKKRAVAQNEFQRSQLRMQYGLNNAGGIDANNTTGSIYQGNLNAANNQYSALANSVARGLGTGGGLGARQTTMIHDQALNNQAQQIQQATGQLGNLGIQDQLADTDYNNATASIGRGQADELAQQLAANPVYTPPPVPGPVPGPVAAPPNPYTANKTPQQVSAMLKKNPVLAWRT